MDLNFEAAELKVSDFSQEDVFNSIDLSCREKERDGGDRSHKFFPFVSVSERVTRAGGSVK